MDRSNKRTRSVDSVSVPFWLGCSLMATVPLPLSVLSKGFSALLVGLFIDGDG